jgi:hypothetical protein
MVTQDGDLQFDGGGKQAGLRPLPLPQPQGFSSPVLGRGECRVGVGPCVGGGLLLPSVIEGKGGCCPWRWQLPRAWLSNPSGFGAALGAGFRHGSWKRFFHRRDSWGRLRTDLQLYGLLPVLASRVWAWAGGPGSSIRPEVIAAAVRPPGAEVVVVAAAGASDGVPFVGLLLLRRPPPIEWGCSYLRRWNQSSICNGTLNAGVFVHCGCRGLNMYVFLAQSRVFSSFSRLRLARWLSEPLHQA